MQVGDLMYLIGHVIAQAVSHWLPNAAAWVHVWLPNAAARVHVRAVCGVCGGQSGTVAGFLRILRFPLPITNPPISPLP
jgi:hypothetical protein